MNIDPINNEEDPQVSNRAVGSHRMRRLPLDFVPSDDDVICGRGKKCYSHIGNDRFRTRVHSVLSLYRSAKNKLDKSKVLNMVVDQVRYNSPSGGFVKQDETGRWHEVGDFLAREKTSQVFRDALHENYKSSNVSKKKRRQEELSKASDKLKMPRSTMDIARKIESISMDMKNCESLRIFFPFIFFLCQLKISFWLQKTTAAKRSPGSAFVQPSEDILTGIRNASRDMREDSCLPDRYSSMGGARISSSNAAGFNFEFEPEAGVRAPYRTDGRSASFSHPENVMEPIGDFFAPKRYSEIMNGQRAASVPNVPQGPFDLGDDQYSHGSEDVHHSLPILHFDPDDLEVDQTERLYQSAPNLCQYSPSDLMQADDPPDMRVPEAPVPSTIEFQMGRSAVPGDLLGRFEREFVANEEPAAPPTRGIVSSLERFAGMELEDDNPFEPIPIHQDTIFNKREREKILYPHMRH